jgi:hypothetical protein
LLTSQIKLQTLASILLLLLFSKHLKLVGFILTSDSPQSKQEGRFSVLLCFLNFCSKPIAISRFVFPILVIDRNLQSHCLLHLLFVSEVQFYTDVLSKIWWCSRCQSPVEHRKLVLRRSGQVQICTEFLSQFSDFCLAWIWSGPCLP